MRSLLSLLAGYLVFTLATVGFGLVTGREPGGGFVGLLSAAYGMIFAAVGGFVAARLVRKRRLHHALALGGIIAVVSIASLMSGSPSGFPWPEWATILLVAPSAVIGGMLAVRNG